MVNGLRLAFQTKWPRSLLAFLLTAIIWHLGLSSAIAFPRMCFIDQARQQPDGAEVVVTGTVTVPSGWFRSANSDAGFVIQDSTGGIYVTTDQNLDLSLGETVEVTGQLTDDGHGQRMLALTDWHRRDRALPSIAPKVVSAQRAGRDLDGQLVTVQGKIVQPLQDDAPYGDRLWIADDSGKIQIYMPKSTHIEPQQLPFLKVGQWIRVTGLSSQFDQNDEVVPRSRADIEWLQ